MRTKPRRAGRCSGDPRRRAGAQSTSCRASPASSPSLAARPRILPRSPASAAFRWCSACSMRRGAFPTARRSRSTASPAWCGGSPDARKTKRASAHLRHAAGVRAGAQARCARWRASTSFADSGRIIPKRTLIAAVRKADILFCLLHDKIDRAVVTANPDLRLIAAQSITPSNIDVEAATARRIPVTVTAPITTEATADLNFGLMLAVARRMIEGDRLARAGKFPGGQSAHLMGSLRLGQDARPRRRRRPDRQGGGEARARFFDARSLLDAAAQAGTRRTRSGTCLRAARPIAARIRFRLAAFATQQGDAAPDRRPRTAADEKDRLHRQYRARPDHRRSSASQRARQESRSPAPVSTCSSTSRRSPRR